MRLFRPGKRAGCEKRIEHAIRHHRNRWHYRRLLSHRRRHCQNGQHAKRKEYGIRCTVESTGGSVFNINAIMAGDLEFGVAQSDRQYQAYKGIADWEDKGPQKDLRAVFSIHPETVDLIAAVDAKIDSLQDLKGKRVNMGNVGSGYRKNAIDALMANGLDFEKDFHAESLKAAKRRALIQDGRIDAAFYTVGHPSGYYKEATSGTRKVKFIPITNARKPSGKIPLLRQGRHPGDRILSGCGQ
jgi:TRAP transporter TAXI family solute receptor